MNTLEKFIYQRDYSKAKIGVQLVVLMEGEAPLKENNKAIAEFVYFDSF